MTRTETIWRHPDHPPEDLSLGVEEESEGGDKEVEEILDIVGEVG